MLGIKTPPRGPDVDEAEKPFWISYSDLMTALMVLFLVAMSVSLFSITQGPGEHRKKVDACMAEVDSMSSRDFPGVEVKGHSISFGTLALFPHNSHRLDPTAEATLSRMLKIASSPSASSLAGKNRL